MKDRYKLYPKWHNKPFRLTSEEIEKPAKVLKDFCWEFAPGEVRLLLWELYVSSTKDKLSDRAINVVLYEHIDRLIEAVFVLYQGKD